MNRPTLFVTAFAAALLISNPVLAKGKGQGKEKHQSQSQLENTNRQPLEDSRRGQERAEQRHDMHDQQDYGQPRNPVDTIIDRNVDNLKSGVHDLNRRAVDGLNEGARDLSAPQPRRR